MYRTSLEIKTKTKKLKLKRKLKPKPKTKSKTDTKTKTIFLQNFQILSINCALVLITIHGMYTVDTFLLSLLGFNTK